MRYDSKSKGNYSADYTCDRHNASDYFIEFYSYNNIENDILMQ